MVCEVARTGWPTPSDRIAMTMSSAATSVAE
jgi:hypothetical protein